MDLHSLGEYLAFQVIGEQMTQEMALAVANLFTSGYSAGAMQVWLVALANFGLTPEQLSVLLSFNQQINVEPEVPPAPEKNPLEIMLESLIDQGVDAGLVNDLRQWLQNGTEDQAKNALQSLLDSGKIHAMTYAAVWQWLQLNAEWASGGGGGGGGGGGSPSGVAPFSWTAANYPREGGATTDQTRASYYAVTNRGKLSDFSYMVWNDLCRRVRDAAEAAGAGWNAKYLSYDETLMTIADRAITADRFNSLNHNVNLRSTTGVGVKRRGDQIKGSFFTSVVDALNNWINSMSS